ncbi:GDP-mannose transporter GONST3 [Durusdinium trenchii]|uniref:GDP-mannose transporter GONST3 n=1 Tax=Durusdinium trenchii TaxID=1381693 RepID=A0ABP0IFH2_9DINO
MLSKSCRLASILNLALLASAAQPHSHHVEVTSQGLLRADEKLQPKPRLATCAGRKLDCAGADDPCAQATDCNAHHACTGSGHRNCMKNTELSGPVCATNMDGCVPACKGKVSSSAADCRSLPEGTKCSSSYVVIENVATQCFATLGHNDEEIECENGSPCGDEERENPYTGTDGRHRSWMHRSKNFDDYEHIYIYTTH